jgi:hypothetical protein
MPDEQPGVTIETRLPKILLWIDLIAKISIGVIAVCYAAGLLIKNIYLAGWSTFTPRLIQAEYVLSGALFLLSFLLGVAFWLAVSVSMRQIRIRRNRQRQANVNAGRWIARVWMLVAFAVALAGVGLVIAAMSRNGVEATSDALAALSIIVPPGIVIFARSAFADIWEQLLRGREKVTGSTQARWFFVALPFLAALGLHATFVYPHVSPAYGGGRHVPVLVRVRPDGEPILREMSFLADRSDNRLFSGEIIAEDDTYVTLTTQNTRRPRAAVRLRRDYIESIVTGGAVAR